MGHYVTLCDTMWHYVTLCSTMWHYVPLCETMSHYMTLFDTFWYLVTLIYIQVTQIKIAKNVYTLSSTLKPKKQTPVTNVHQLQWKVSYNCFHIVCMSLAISLGNKSTWFHWKYISLTSLATLSCGLQGLHQALQNKIRKPHRKKKCKSSYNVTRGGILPAWASDSLG